MEENTMEPREDQDDQNNPVIYLFEEEDTDYSATPYDNVFRTIIQYLGRHLIFLVNRLFGTSFTGSEKIERGTTEIMGRRPDGKFVRRGVDSFFTIIGEDGSRHVFHIECQSNPDGTIEVRLAEYGLQLALLGAIREEDGSLTLSLPSQAVIYLRAPKEKTTPMIRYRAQGHTLEYPIHVLRMEDHTTSSLFARDLIALLPFYLFTHEVDIRKIAEDPRGLDLLMHEFKDICERLQNMEDIGELNTHEHALLLELTRIVARNTAPDTAFSEGVWDMAGTHIIDLEINRIYDEGIAQGQRKEREALIANMRAQGLDEALIQAVVPDQKSTESDQ